MHSSATFLQSFWDGWTVSSGFIRSSRTVWNKSHSRCSPDCKSVWSESKLPWKFTPEAVQRWQMTPKTTQYGARPMKHYLTQKVENALANRMLHEEIHAGDAIRLTAAENQFVVLDCVGTHSNS